MRGILSVAIIEQMEKMTGRPAYELFDCFIGTSAGSLIAAGLAAGHSASTLKDKILSLGKDLPAAMQKGGQDSSELLEQVTQELFGVDTLPYQARKRFAVVTRNTEIGKVIFFGNFPSDAVDAPSFWQGAGVDECADPIWQIVVRSAALPPFFAKSGAYLDGGVSPFANPTYAAYVGVQRRLGWNPYREALKFFSVGTGYHNAVDDGHNQPSMVAMMMQDINFLQHQIMKRERDNGHIWYQRYNIEFSPEGFAKLGIPVSDPDQLSRLASTASADLDGLQALGTLVGQKLVRPEDFGEWPQRPVDRRRLDQPVAKERRKNPTRALSPIPDQGAPAADR